MIDFRDSAESRDVGSTGSKSSIQAGNAEPSAQQTAVDENVQCENVQCSDGQFEHGLTDMISDGQPDGSLPANFEEYQILVKVRNNRMLHLKPPVCSENS